MNSRLLKNTINRKILKSDDGVNMEQVSKSTHNRKLQDVFVVLFTCFFLLIFGFSLFSIFFNKQADDLQFSKKIYIVMALLYGAFICVFYKNVLRKITDKKIHNKRLALFFLILFSAQCFIAWSVYGNNGWDSQIVLTGADNFITGRTNEFGVYFLNYPNNIPLLSFYRYYFTILNMLGISNYLLGAIVVSIIAIDISILFLFLTTNILFEKKEAIFVLFIATFLIGFSPWISVPYTDTLTLPFPIIMLYLLVQAIKQNEKYKWTFVGLAGAISFIGCKFKPTQYIIYVALAISVFLFNDIKENKLKKMAITVSVFVVGVLVSMLLCNVVIHKATGKVFTKEEIQENRFPFTHYIMMGLAEPYGAYNDADVEATREQKGYNAKVKYNLQESEHRVREMGIGKYTLFLMRKLNFTLQDGTFHFGLEGGFHLTPAITQNEVSNQIQRLYRADGDLYFLLANWQQAQWLVILFFGVISGFINFKQKRNAALFFSQLCMVGVVLFNLLFEARSRYLFSFLPFFILSAIYGMIFLTETIKNKNKEV